MIIQSEASMSGSWEELFARLRAQDNSRWVPGLRLRKTGEPAEDFLRRVEQTLVRIYGPEAGDEARDKIGWMGALLWGLLLGDLLVHEFGAAWVYPAWTGRDLDNCLDCAVVVPVPGDEDGASTFPMRRVAMFVTIDRKYTLVSTYRFARDLAAGAVTLDGVAPGEWNRREGYRYLCAGGPDQTGAE
jgi:hypothetical protein